MKTLSIALIAHDHCKSDLMVWAKNHQEILLTHQLICTGTTGQHLQTHLGPTARIERLKSGPLGGDQQMGARIAEGEIDLIVFLWDPMRAQPHDVDVKALLRLAVLYNIPTACNIATADFLLQSHCFGNYKVTPRNHHEYLNRVIAP